MFLLMLQFCSFHQQWQVGLCQFHLSEFHKVKYLEILVPTNIKKVSCQWSSEQSQTSKPKAYDQQKTVAFSQHYVVLVCFHYFIILHVNFQRDFVKTPCRVIHESSRWTTFPQTREHLGRDKRPTQRDQTRQLPRQECKHGSGAK